MEHSSKHLIDSTVGINRPLFGGANRVGAKYFWEYMEYHHTDRIRNNQHCNWLPIRRALRREHFLIYILFYLFLLLLKI